MVLSAWPATAETWSRVSVPGIELYTTESAKPARDMMLRLEQVRGFFALVSPARKLTEAPLRIVEFTNPDEYQRFNPGRIAESYYASLPSRDYIVLGPAAEKNFGVVVHEYMHLTIRRSGFRLPVWLNEGWAEVFSTMRTKGNETAVGDLIPGRVRSLMEEQWLDFETLTTATAQSPLYNEAARAGIFYAESWALAHMLYLAPEYQANFGKFITALNAGRTAGDACQAAWGRTGEQVFADLRTYFKGKKLAGRIYDARLDREQQEPQVEAASEFDKNVLLAEVMESNGNVEQARAAFEKLDKEKPGQAKVARSLGELASARKDPEAARAYFEKAFDAGEQDWAMCLSLALLEQQKRDTAKMVAALDRAIHVRPGNTEATMLLGLGQLDLRRFEAGIATLMGIEEIRPQFAPAVYCGLAVAEIQTGDLETAREHLGTCRVWSKAEEDVKRVTLATTFLEARAKPEAGVRKGEKLAAARGNAVGIECDDTGARLRVQVSGGMVLFDVPSADAVELTPVHGGQLNLKCGAMAAVPVSVEFAPPRTAIGRTAGIVRRLEF